MDRREPPPTEEGWFCLHDFRWVDWDAWRAADEETRARVVEEGGRFLADAEALEDADAGASVTYGILGHKADLLLLHLRPTLAQLDALERRFERTGLAEVTDRAASYVSVTEVSGYTTPEAFEGEGLEAVEDAGLRNYLETRLHPTLPEAEFVSFYPMDKRREGADNWYALPFEERAEHLRAHGEIGREFAGEVTQVITGSIGLDDWEWGVTLFSDDATAFKRLLYEMRFDPSSARFAEFGPFFTGRRLAPDALADYLAGEPLGAVEAGSTPDAASTDIREALEAEGIYAGQPHGEDVHALVLFADSEPDELLEAVEGLRANFDHYDTHERTSVYTAVDGDETAVVSLWATERAAETAAGYLADLSGVLGRAEQDGDGWQTMGLFYTVTPEHREDFVGTFDDVRDRLDDLAGHRETALLANLEDEHDFFIASRWTDREAAMAFFRGDAFRDAVEWGREVLADRPRHVFLA